MASSDVYGKEKKCTGTRRTPRLAIMYEDTGLSMPPDSIVTAAPLQPTGMPPAASTACAWTYAACSRTSRRTVSSGSCTSTTVLGNASASSPPTYCDSSMLVMGKRLSERLVSTLKLRAAVIASCRYVLASAVMASLSFSQAAARVIVAMPNTLRTASYAASRSAASSAASMYSADCRYVTRKWPMGLSRRLTFATSLSSK